MPIRISSAINGFRRAGVAHPSTPTVYPDDFFSAEQIKQLKAEPRLAVEFGNFETADPADPGADQEGAVEPNSVPGELIQTERHLAGVMEQDGTLKDLHDLTVAELRDLTKEMEINGTSSMNKAELIAAIQAQPVQFEPEGEA